jgi:hypothetical protein
MTPTSREFSLTIPADGDGSVTAGVRSFDVASEPAYRTLTHSAEREAHDLWRDMDDERRAALISLVADALTELARDPESWLAEGLTSRDNQTIGVSILFRLGVLDTQIMQMRNEHEAEQRQRIADLTRISTNDAVSSSA